MKNLMFFLTLIGLLLVNFNVSAQDVEYFNENNPRPEDVELLPTMHGAHRGTNFTFEEVRFAHTKGLNSYLPVAVQNIFAKEKLTTIFGVYEETEDVEYWISVNTNLGSDPNLWGEKVFDYLEPGPAPDGIFLSGGYQSKKASGSKVGPKMIERRMYRKGDREYQEDERFMYLDLGRVCSLPKYQGVKILWISLGCGNHVFPYAPPKLMEEQPLVQKRDEGGGQKIWGSEWVVVNNYYYETYQTQVPQPMQNFSYAGVSFQWGFNYNPCWFSPAVTYPCCMNSVPVSYGGGYSGGSNSGGNTTTTNNINEGDNITNINEGDNIFVFNNNNPTPTPPTPTPDPDDDGGPVLGENGDTPHVPGNTTNTPPVLGENGDPLNPSGNNNPGGNGGNLGGSGLALQSSDSGFQNPETKKTTTSYSDLETQFGLQDTEKKVAPLTTDQSSGKKSLSENELWAKQKEAVFAQREQQQQTGSLPTGRTQPTQQIGDWTTQRQTNNSGNQSVRQNGGMSQQTTERKPQNFQTENQQRNPVGEWNQGSNQQMRQPATQQSSGSNAERYPVSGTQNRIPNTQRPSYTSPPQNNGGVTTARAPQVNSNSGSYSGNTGRIPSGVSSAPQGRQPVMSSPSSTMRTPSFNGGGMSGGMRSPGGMSGGGGMRTR